MSELEVPLEHLVELLRLDDDNPQPGNWKTEMHLVQLAFTWPRLACRLADLLEAMGEPIPRPLQRARTAERENQPW